MGELRRLLLRNIEEANMSEAEFIRMVEDNEDYQGAASDVLQGNAGATDMFFAVTEETLKLREDETARLVHAAIIDARTRLHLRRSLEDDGVSA